MKTKKTYGVSGLMEWHAMVPAGGARLHIHFAGGALTGYGVTPAEYSTDDLLIQRIIESSDYFKTGKITILRTIEVDGNDRSIFGKKGSKPVVAQQDALPEEKQEEVVEEPLAEVTVTDLEEAKEYLVEQYGIARSKLRSKVAIVDSARENGIVFTGI